jgi:ATP-dependent RNA helicase RhlE
MVNTKILVVGVWMKEMVFKDLKINENIIRAVAEMGYNELTEIQKDVIGPVLSGRDVVGLASTGTGKTAAFSIPIIDMLLKDKENSQEYNAIKALVLTPTRELAIQVGEDIESYAKYIDIKAGAIYGGVTPKRHIKVIKREPNILVATPGRLLDLIGKEAIDLSNVSMLVIDEADRMLEKEMLKDVKQIIKELPNKKQNLLFSATMPKEIEKLANSLLNNAIKVEVKDNINSDNKIKEVIYHVDETIKTMLLIDLLKEEEFESILIFTRTKKKADKVSKAINIANIPGMVSKAIHSDKNQSEREKAMEKFKAGDVKILVATDIAARGIDVKGLSHVINMNVPNVPETYIHRIGRTGRAGKEGIAITFCSDDEEEYLDGITKMRGNNDGK